MKMQSMNLDFISNQILLESLPKLFQFIQLMETMLKDLMLKKYYSAKGIRTICNVIIKGKNIYDQELDSDIKCYEESKTMTIGQGDNYTSGCLLDYDYIKNHYRLIAADLSIQRELDTNSKVIQQIELVEQLEKLDAEENAIDKGKDQSMFLLRMQEKIKKRF